jgi:acetyl esterase
LKHDIDGGDVSVLGAPKVAAVLARMMQGQVSVTGGTVTRRRRIVFPELPGNTREITIPAPVAPARAVVYRPASRDPCPPVHVNLHGSGYVVPGFELDDPLCRYLAAEAGVVVVNVDYVVAPQHPFPALPHQAFQVVRWVAAHGAEHGWDGGRLTVGGQSAGGGLAAAVARQALEQGGPAIGLQVLHYPPLDLTTRGKDKPSVIAKPMLRPWMTEIFDGAYVAPALVITPGFDRLHAEGQRYAQRLRKAGALAGHHDVPQADHAYDMSDAERARQTYALIARFIK